MSDIDMDVALRNVLPPFIPFPKIGRLNRNAVITEKIDGSNAQIHITEAGEVFAGSRKRWVTPGDDNFGFAAWVFENRDELAAGLGAGTHYGEWWGAGIQRAYGQSVKRFSLFNTSRWGGGSSTRPACCDVVPVLGFAGKLTDLSVAVDSALNNLRAFGSQAAPGFMDPEGLVVYHSATNHLYKVTLANDEKPKEQVAAEARAELAEAA